MRIEFLLLPSLLPDYSRDDVLEIDVLVYRLTCLPGTQKAGP